MSTARHLPTDCPRQLSDHLLFEGIRVPFFYEPDRGWRIRKRSMHLTVDFSTGLTDRAKARKRALAWLEERKNGEVTLTGKSVEDLVTFYLAMPRRASNVTANYNITQLRAICRKVLGRELSKIKLHEIRPKLWEDFMRQRSGGKLDLSKARPEHTTINTAVRAAASIFKKKLRPAYQRAGYDIPADATVIEWLKQLIRPPRTLDEAKMLKAWRDLPRGAMWMTLGLARYAGLRKEEINGCRGAWLEQRGERWGVVVCDRPEDGFWCKNGDPRFAVILDAAVLKALKKVKKDDFAVQLDSARDQWFKLAPQAWLRSYLSRDTVKKPLHRLRGLYLDQVKASAEARLQKEALREAADAAGHKSTKTTVNHYTSQP